MKQVTLDLYELMASANNGLTRVFESMRLNQEWGHGYKSSLNEKIARSISGSGAELACSKLLDIEFTYHVNHGNNPDLIFHDLHLQVRCQMPKENNGLIIRPKGAKPNEIYILVIDKSPIYEVCGFINSSFVLGTNKYLTNLGNGRPKCHYIPKDILTPIEILKNGKWN